jgi:hypothetical protein
MAHNLVLLGLQLQALVLAAGTQAVVDQGKMVVHRQVVQVVVALPILMVPLIQAVEAAELLELAKTVVQEL